MLFMKLVGILRKPDKFLWRRIIITEAITGNIECFLRGTILSGSYHLSTHLSCTALRWLLLYHVLQIRKLSTEHMSNLPKVTQLVNGGTEIQTHSVPNVMPLTSMWSVSANLFGKKKKRHLQKSWFLGCPRYRTLLPSVS